MKPHLILTLLAPSFLSAQEPIHGLIEVEQVDTGNSGSSVIVTTGPTGNLGVSIDPNGSRTNRGDVTLDLTGVTEVANGILIASVAENGRSNKSGGGPDTTFYPSVSVSNSVLGTNYSIHTSRYANGQTNNSVEFNVNTSYAWFPYTDWAGGYIRVDVTGALSSLNSSSGDILFGTELTEAAPGVYTLNDNKLPSAIAQ